MEVVELEAQQATIAAEDSPLTASTSSIRSQQRLLPEQSPEVEPPEPLQEIITEQPNPPEVIHSEPVTHQNETSQGIESVEEQLIPQKVMSPQPASRDEESQLRNENSASAQSITFGEDQSVYFQSLNYDPEAGYDPCREWLRLITGLVSMVIAIVTVYPIHLGVDCYLDQYKDGDIDLSQCKNLFKIEYSITTLAVSVVLEAFMIFLFIYSCRHEFCGVKRDYKHGLLFCSPLRSKSPVVYPMSTENTKLTPKLIY